VEKPVVSFVIPVLNGAADIARCLHSILALQALDEPYEVLVMDNGSTDHTPEIVEALGFDCHIVPKVHVSALRNRGVALAQGEYIAFVDADVELTPHWIRHGLAALRAPGIVACGCFPRVPPQATWVQRTWDVHQRGKTRDSVPRPVAWLPSMNLLVRRDAFLAIGGFNESLETTEDVDLCYRLGQYGTILCTPAMQAIHWGEAPDLRIFWRKEVWRALGSLKGIVAHGLRWDELPSLGYPLYMLLGVCGLVVGSMIDLWREHSLFAPLALCLLTLPALLLALNTARQVWKVTLVPPLFVLYFLYGLARAYAMIKPWMPV
jgi:glycosyltransferase involved in cell wall biosynthesis